MIHFILDQGVNSRTIWHLVEFPSERRVLPDLPLEGIEAELSVFDHLPNLMHFLLSEKPLALLNTLVDSNAFDLISDLFPLPVVVILLKSACAEGQKHHTFLEVLPGHIVQDVFVKPTSRKLFCTSSRSGENILNFTWQKMRERMDNR